MGPQINVLDKGFVRLVDHMGDDRAIVEAARNSIAGERVKAIADDRTLIRYLLRHRHTTPFEMVEFKFHMKLPIFVARQLIRHRTASVNEMSGRYGVLPEEYYVPDPADIQFQDPTNKQGRSGVAVLKELADVVRMHFESSADTQFELYHDLLADREPAVDDFAEFHEEMQENGGIARELARICLPLSTYTAWYWKIDLWNLMHFMRLRSDAHAQKEIRVYSLAMEELIKPLVPFAYEAFVDYIKEAMTLSRVEWEALRGLFEDCNYESGYLDSRFPNKRERDEFEAKLRRLALKKMDL